MRLADGKNTQPGDRKGWLPLVHHNLNVSSSAQNPHVEDGATLDTRLVDPGLCTSAAPTYFRSHEHPEFGRCVDGGLFANCPASIAMSAAVRAGKPQRFH
jgi:patatin-like phospholipase/acyl hydrolase